MLYEIINPSDPYTIEAKSLDVAFVACLFLGSGQYVFQPIGKDDGVEIPLFIFGGTEEWCVKHFNDKTLEAVIDEVTGEKASELAECFESCVIGRADDRDAFYAGSELIDDPEKRERWRARWQDKRCSSTNDIGARAYKMAKKLRAGAANPLVPAPNQVFA